MLYRFAHFILGLLFKLLYRIRVYGLDRVPPGAGIICGNHSSLGDPVILALALKPTQRLRFMAKKELFGFKPFAWLISALGAFPVDRGSADMKAIKTSLEVLRQGQKLVVLPTGHRIRGEDKAAVKNGAAMLAARTGAPITPVYISEGRKPFVNKIRVVFGDSYEFSKEGGRVSPKDYGPLMDEVMAKVFELGKIE